MRFKLGSFEFEISLLGLIILACVLGSIAALYLGNK